MLNFGGVHKKGSQLPSANYPKESCSDKKGDVYSSHSKNRIQPIDLAVENVLKPSETHACITTGVDIKIEGIHSGNRTLRASWIACLSFA